MRDSQFYWQCSEGTDCLSALKKKYSTDSSIALNFIQQVRPPGAAFSMCALNKTNLPVFILRREGRRGGKHAYYVLARIIHST